MILSVFSLYMWYVLIINARLHCKTLNPCLICLYAGILYTCLCISTQLMSMFAECLVKYFHVHHSCWVNYYACTIFRGLQGLNKRHIPISLTSVWCQKVEQSLKNLGHNRGSLFNSINERICLEICFSHHLQARL